MESGEWMHDDGYVEAIIHDRVWLKAQLGST